MRRNMVLTAEVDKFHPQTDPPPFVYRLLSNEERTIPRCKAEEVQCFHKGDRVKVEIASVVDLNNFHVILEANRDEVDRIESCLSTAATFGLLPYHPMRNETTIACTKNADKRWCRIQILKIDSMKDQIHVTVRFIDSGVEMVTTPSQIRAVPDWMLEIPQFAIHCSLIIRPLAYVYQGVDQAGTVSWAPQIIESFSKLGKYDRAADRTAFQGLELRCIKMENGTSLVNITLLPRGSSWTKSLVESNVAAWIDGIHFEGDRPIWSEERNGSLTS